MFAREPDEFDLMPFGQRLKIAYGFMFGGMASIGFGASLNGLSDQPGWGFLMPVGIILICAGLFGWFIGGVFGAVCLYCAACGRPLRLIPWHRCPRCGTWLWSKRPPDLRDG